MRRVVMTMLAIGCWLLATSVSAADGQESQKEWQLKARIGYNIGATTPLGIPATVRSLETFRLTPNWMVGADVMIPFRQKWGAMAGLCLENKGMDVEVTTKGYRMKLKMEDDELEGLYTGHVRQKVRQWMFTVPVLATYQISPSLLLKAGPYVSVVFDKNFYGTASDGYLRKDDPTGMKVVMGTEESQWATYDFPDEMRTWQFGLAVGADWQFYRQFGMTVNLSWGLTGVMKGDFETVEQTLYPIYGQIGVFYRIR